MNDYFADNALFSQTFDMTDLEKAVTTGHNQMPIVEVVPNTDPNYIPPKPDAVHWHLSDSAKSILRTLHTQKEQIESAVRIIRECRDNLGTVYTCGNGGSAATASHLVNDLVKAAGCRAICLTDSIPLLTAYSNDESYGMALYEIANRLFRKGDVVFAISVSGTSPNVVMAEAVKTARPYAVPVIGLGSLMQGAKDGRNTRFYADVFIEAQTEDMATAEDVHLAICHAIVKGLAE